MSRGADEGRGRGIRGRARKRARRVSLNLSLTLDFQLTDEQRLISETARDFADKEIAPRVRENDRASRFDRELASMLGEMGYLGAPVSEEYGVPRGAARGGRGGGGGGGPPGAPLCAWSGWGAPPPRPARWSRSRPRWSPA